MSETPEKRLYILFAENAKVHAKAHEHFEDIYQLDTHASLIRTETLADDISTAIGLDGDDASMTGVILKINHTYAGFFNPSLWEWLD